MALWSGRFSEKTDELVARYTESISYDRRLYPFEIAGSKAHAEMLAKQGIIPQEDAEAYVKEMNQPYCRIIGRVVERQNKDVLFV